MRLSEGCLINRVQIHFLIMNEFYRHGVPVSYIYSKRHIDPESYGLRVL